VTKSKSPFSRQENKGTTSRLGKGGGKEGVGGGHGGPKLPGENDEPEKKKTIKASKERGKDMKKYQRSEKSTYL